MKEKDLNKLVNFVLLMRYCFYCYKGINFVNKIILNCLFVENVNLVIEKDIDYRYRIYCLIFLVFGFFCGERE